MNQHDPSDRSIDHTDPDTAPSADAQEAIIREQAERTQEPTTESTADEWADDAEQTDAPNAAVRRPRTPDA